MKSFFRKSCFFSFVLLALWVAISFLPSDLPAQDIDDVIDSLDQDFSLGNKREIKESNKAAANEQNREDIQIQLNESSSTPTTGATVTGNLTVSFAAGPPTNDFQWNSITVNGTTVPVNQMVSIPSGSVPVTVSNVTVPSGVSFSFGINLTCTSGPCNATLTMSGVINCTIATGNMSLNMPTNFTTTCTTQAAS